MSSEGIDAQQIVVTDFVSKLKVDIAEFTAQVTTNTSDYTVDGVGIFDVMMDTATKHLVAQFDGNRVRAEDYANMYVQIYQATLQAAVQIWLQKGLTEQQAALLEAQALAAQEQIPLTKAQVDLTKAQALAAAKQPELVDKQIEVAKEQVKVMQAQAQGEEAKKWLYKRQIEGFDEEYKYKILKVLMDSWAVGFSVAKDSFQASGIPAPMQKVTIDDLYNTYVKADFDKYTYGRNLSG